MSRFFTLKKQFVFLSALCFSFSTIAVFGQSICGPIVEDFNNPANGMAGFTSTVASSSTPGFDYQTSGGDGFLSKCNVPSGGLVYQITTPTYQSLASQNFIGFGFELDGAITVGRVVALLQYENFGNPSDIQTVEVSNFAPSYTCPSTGCVAAECRAFAMSQFQGLLPGGRYRFIFQLTSSSPSAIPTDCITFDDFRTTGTNALSPLPVNFIGLYASRQPNGVSVKWDVADERNVKEYQIERSDNGTIFKTIGSALPNGKNVYSYIDANAGAGTLLYRIKNVDIDGKFKYSYILRLKGANSYGDAMRVYPSPARSQTTVEHGKLDPNATISIMNVEGRVIKTIKPVTGASHTPVDLSGMATGTYILRLNDGKGKTETQKFIKQ